MDPPYADSVVSVQSIVGFFLSFLYTFIRRTLASAPVSSLNVIFPHSICTAENQEEPVMPWTCKACMNTCVSLSVSDDVLSV